MFLATADLGPQLLDPPSGGGELKRLVGTQTLELTAVDPVLLEPVIDLRSLTPNTSASWATFVADRVNSIT